MIVQNGFSILVSTIVILFAQMPWLKAEEARVPKKLEPIIERIQQASASTRSLTAEGYSFTGFIGRDGRLIEPAEFENVLWAGLCRANKSGLSQNDDETIASLDAITSPFFVRTTDQGTESTKGIRTRSSWQKFKIDMTDNRVVRTRTFEANRKSTISRNGEVETDFTSGYEGSRPLVTVTKKPSHVYIEPLSLFVYAPRFPQIPYSWELKTIDRDRSRFTGSLQGQIVQEIDVDLNKNFITAARIFIKEKIASPFRFQEEPLLLDDDIQIPQIIADATFYPSSSSDGSQVLKRLELLIIQSASVNIEFTPEVFEIRVPKGTVIHATDRVRSSLPYTDHARKDDIIPHEFIDSEEFGQPYVPPRSVPKRVPKNMTGFQIANLVAVCVLIAYTLFLFRKRRRRSPLQK